MGTDPFLEMQKSLGLTPKLPNDNPYYQYESNSKVLEDAGYNPDSSYNPYDQGGDAGYNPDSSYNPYDQGGDAGYNPDSSYNPGSGYNPPKAKAYDANEDQEHTYWKKSASIEYDADDLMSDLKNL
jgi:hypothetical protein